MQHTQNRKTDSIKAERTKKNNRNLQTEQHEQQKIPGRNQVTERVVNLSYLPIQNIWILNWTIKKKWHLTVSKSVLSVLKYKP